SQQPLSLSVRFRGRRFRVGCGSAFIVRRFPRYDYLAHFRSCVAGSGSCCRIVISRSQSYRVWCYYSLVWFARVSSLPRVFCSISRRRCFYVAGCTIIWWHICCRCRRCECGRSQAFFTLQMIIQTQTPNKSPEPTAVATAVAIHAASRRWLSFLRLGHKKCAWIYKNKDLGVYLV